MSFPSISITLNSKEIDRKALDQELIAIGRDMDNDIVINKDNNGSELFCMIVKFSEIKAIYKELRDKPKVHHLKANNIEIK